MAFQVLGKSARDDDQDALLSHPYTASPSLDESPWTPQRSHTWCHPTYNPLGASNGKQPGHRGRKIYVWLFGDEPVDTLIAWLSALNAAVETSLLLYLLVSYLTLPRDPLTGKLPRIASLYATFPYISCIGSMHLAPYQTFTFFTVLLSVAATSISFYRSWNTELNFWLRRLQWTCLFAYNAFALWLMFAAADADRHLHLLVASLKSLAVFATRSCSLLMDHFKRGAYPVLGRYQMARILRCWRRVDGIVAFPLALLLNISIYACNDPATIQDPSATCYKIVSVGAPAEWFYTITTIFWTLCTGFDTWLGPRMKRVIEEAEISAAHKDEDSDDGRPDSLDSWDEDDFRAPHKSILKKIEMRRGSKDDGSSVYEALGVNIMEPPRAVVVKEDA